MAKGFSMKYSHYNGLDAEIADLTRRIQSLEARPELSAAMERLLRNMRANRELAIAKREAANMRRAAR